MSGPKKESVSSNGNVENLNNATSPGSLLEKAERALEIQNRIAKRLSIFNSKVKTIHSSSVESPIIADFNSEKKCAPVWNEPTFCYESRNSSIVHVNENKSNIGTSNINKSTEFIDPRLLTKKKTKKPLRFIREGAFTKEEHKLNNPNFNCRKKRNCRELFYQNDESIFSKVSIPEFEHWDMPFIKQKETVLDGEFPFEILVSKINNLIEHPVPIEPHYDPNEGVSSTIFLTPKEKARLRKRNRQEKTMEKQDRIRMGIDPPVPPKLKLTNLLNVLTEKAIAEPTCMESEIKRQRSERVMLHESRNSSLKLNHDDMNNKKADKWKLDPESPVVHSAIFKIGNLRNKRYIFKIDRNAQDCHLTGCCVISTIDPCVILIEGSKKSVQFYKNLLQNRIKWDQPKETETYCSLIWEGIRPSRIFLKWKLYYCHSKEDAYKFFLDNNSLDLWNISQN
ncbi:putative U4/U6 associated RNA splicing factor [Cryptosporidium canis]|uniref:U4/U6 associated RNA splicing factor n=1 Tax=Cryptosporidium canis TaxID=195482 RepID=A0A9D5HYH4_9CRYT|nr:putative U4/U6 associated RNA splicing factor [Cryptosporidium canis]